MCHLVFWNTLWNLEKQMRVASRNWSDTSATWLFNERAICRVCRVKRMTCRLKSDRGSDD